jgi:hypothetical protein
MTSQVTNRREGGFTSCCSCSRKLLNFTWKELETVRAAQKLLGALTISGGNARQGVEVEGVKGVKYAPMPPEMHENGKKTGGFAYFLAYTVNRQKCHFSLKST